MIKVNVKFFGNERDRYGMPKPYHSYLIVSSPWQQENSGVASAIPISIDAPLPNSPHRFVLDGGPEKAYKEMLALLRSLSQNQGLNELIDKE